MACLYDRYEIGELALSIIKEKGYSVEFLPNIEIYVATDGVWKFRADFPTALLGLILVKETYPDSNPNEYFELLIYSEVKDLLKFSRPVYTPIYKMKKL